MEPSTPPPAGIKDIRFSNGNHARAVVAPAEADPADLLRTLGIEQAQALLLISGGPGAFDKDVEARLIQLFSRSIARAALAAGAVIVDGGTQAGVSALMGRGVADRGRQSVLLGVAAAGRVTYPGGPAAGSLRDSVPLDPDHSHFVLVETDGRKGAAEMTFALAGALAARPRPATPGEKAPAAAPVVMVLAGGEAASRDEALRCVRHGWPLVVVQHSGGVADEIAAAWRQRPAFLPDPVLAEIIADGDIHLFPLDETAEGLERQILNLFQQAGGDTLLRRAWARFAVYDANANRQQKNFDRMQLSILGLGVLAVLLALTQTQRFGTEPPPDAGWDYHALRYAIILVPILISILLAAANRFKAGNKWILLRAAAEAVKREIFRYRARTGPYGDAAAGPTSRAAKLAENLKGITSQLMTTPVNEAALHPYEGPIPPVMYGAAAEDDGFSVLTPDRYLAVRLGDQLTYFEKKTNALEQRLRRIQWTIFAIGGLSTLLAAVGLELWIALTTALAAAFTTYLEYRQTDYTLIKYNQTATNLDNVRNWWTGLTATEQANPVNINLLVDNTEKILEGELTGWVQQMQDAIAELQKKQVKEPQPAPEDPGDAGPDRNPEAP